MAAYATVLPLPALTGRLASLASIHGGQIIAGALKAEGVDAIFTLTGGHILPILDGCVLEGIRVINVRHEQAATHAAEAYNRLTGRLGVAVVTAGPGVTDAVTGVATAFHSCTPLLLIGGRHLAGQELKGGLQEMDHPRLFESITRWGGTARQVHRLGEYVATAARHAFAGRGGPVFLDVPMDVQFETVEETAVVQPTSYRSTHRVGVDTNTLAEIVARMTGATRPVIFAGFSSHGALANELGAIAEAWQAPTYLNGKARGSLPYGHPLLGNHSRSVALAGADCVLALGVDWDFRAKYGETIDLSAFVVQIDADETRIGWNRGAQLGVTADPLTVVAQLASTSSDFAWGERTWSEEILNNDRAIQTANEEEAASSDSPVNPHRFACEVANFFGRSSVVALDGGDIVSTTARWLQISTPGHVLDPGPFGTLGTGPGYAIAAKQAMPDKRVGIVFGDGAFGFNAMEYDTMVRLGLPIIGIVGNDGAWSNIKTLHRMFFPERMVATDLGIRPYHEMVRALGGYGEFVEVPDEIRPALERAAASGQPALVNVHLAESVRLSSNYSQ